MKINSGDKVLVNILAFDGRHKIADKCEQYAYELFDQPNLDIALYKTEEKERYIEITCYLYVLL